MFEFPVVAAAHILPSVLSPLAARSFLRANRKHRDYGWICHLTAVAAAIWLLLALLYVGGAIAALRENVPSKFDETLLQHPFSMWAMLGAPAIPAFLIVVVMTMTRRIKKRD